MVVIVLSANLHIYIYANLYTYSIYTVADVTNIPCQTYLWNNYNFTENQLISSAICI